MTVNHRHDTAAIVIRDIESFDEMRAVEELQKEVWDVRRSGRRAPDNTCRQ